MRRRLLYVWEHPDHPHRERFEENRALVEGLLECENPQAYVDALEPRIWSLRTLTREIPCVIWEFWSDSAAIAGREKEEVQRSSIGPRPIRVSFPI